MTNVKKKNLFVYFLFIYLVFFPYLISSDPKSILCLISSHLWHEYSVLFFQFYIFKAR